jgi:hypothetical protein
VVANFDEQTCSCFRWRIVHGLFRKIPSFYGLDAPKSRIFHAPQIYARDRLPECSSYRGPKTTKGPQKTDSFCSQSHSGVGRAHLFGCLVLARRASRRLDVIDMVDVIDGRLC